jgi:hypothetical protein
MVLYLMGMTLLLLLPRRPKFCQGGFDNPLGGDNGLDWVSPGGQCYDHYFCDFRQFSATNWACFDHFSAQPPRKTIFLK